MKITSKNVIVGNSGWSMIKPRDFNCKDYKKKFGSLLGFYASLFNSAEVNFTFYHLPRISTAKKWMKDVHNINKNFEFTVKASRIITHTRKFEGKEAVNAYNIIKEFTLALGAKIILFQTPARFGPTKENIVKLEKFFNKIDRKGVLLAWEPRGEWVGGGKSKKEKGKGKREKGKRKKRITNYELRIKNKEAAELLKKVLKQNELIHVVDPLRNKSLYQGKKRILYFRLHGFGQPSMYMWQFTDNELKKVYDIIKKTPADKAYVMFNNARQYEDAMRFKKILGVI